MLTLPASCRSRVQDRVSQPDVTGPDGSGIRVWPGQTVSLNGPSFRDSRFGVLRSRGTAFSIAYRIRKWLPSQRPLRGRANGLWRLVGIGATMGGKTQSLLIVSRT
jgi:hypothetical protein